MTKNVVVENWRSYCESTPGFTPAAARNMFRDLSTEIERLEGEFRDAREARTIANFDGMRLREDYDRLRREVKYGNCIHCGCSCEACALMWRDQKKCCPDCPHGN